MPSFSFSRPKKPSPSASYIIPFCEFDMKKFLASEYAARRASAQEPQRDERKPKWAWKLCDRYADALNRMYEPVPAPASKPKTIWNRLGSKVRGKWSEVKARKGKAPTKERGSTHNGKRMVNKDDILIAKAANPWTGRISPDDVPRGRTLTREPRPITRKPLAGRSASKKSKFTERLDLPSNLIPPIEFTESSTGVSMKNGIILILCLLFAVNAYLALTKVFMLMAMVVQWIFWLLCIFLFFALWSLF